MTRRAIGLVSLALVAGTVAAQQGPQLHYMMSGPDCAARGGRIIAWTNSPGTAPVGECYVPPRGATGASVSPSMPAPNRTQQNLQALSTGLGVFMNMLQLADMLNRNSSALPAEPDYSNEDWYKELMQRNAALNRETDGLQDMVRGSSARRLANAPGSQCAAYPSNPLGIAQCHRDLAAEFERKAQACAGTNAESCARVLLRAAAAARCIIARAPDANGLADVAKACLGNPGQLGTLLARPGSGPLAPPGKGESTDCEAHYDEVVAVLADNANACGVDGDALGSNLTLAAFGGRATPTTVIRLGANPDFWEVIDNANDGRWTTEGEYAEPVCSAPLKVRNQREAFTECMRTYVCGLRAAECGRALARRTPGLACAQASARCLKTHPVPK